MTQKIIFDSEVFQSFIFELNFKCQFLNNSLFAIILNQISLHELEFKKATNQTNYYFSWTGAETADDAISRQHDEVSG